MNTSGQEHGRMDPAIDIKQRMNEQIAQVTRQYLANQRSRPGATGRSPDGSVEVTLDGLGDITDVTVRADGVPEEAATKLAQAFRQAWMAAGRQVPLATAESSPLAGQPGMAELVEEQIGERYGVPAKKEEDRPAKAVSDEDFGEDSPLRY